MDLIAIKAEARSAAFARRKVAFDAVGPDHAGLLVDVLAPRDGAVYVDATVGAGGYSRALLEAADCTVWGIDRDPEAAAAGNGVLATIDDEIEHTVQIAAAGDHSTTRAFMARGSWRRRPNSRCNSGNGTIFY